MRKGFAILCIMLGCLACITACSKDSKDTITNVTKSDKDDYYSCQYGDINRKYILHIPEGIKENVPLVLLMPGYAQSAEECQRYTEMDDKADKYGYVVAYVQGESDPYDKSSAAGWNSGIKDKGNDDTGFLVALAHYLQETYHCSSEYTFAVGFSNGAFMSYRLACEASDTFRAVASVCGSMTNGAWHARQEKTSVGILQINGTLDDVVPLNSSSYVHYGDAPAIDGVIEYWNTANGLDKEETKTLSERVTAHCYSGKDTDTQVWYVEIQDGRHGWPNKDLTGIDTSELILEYFNLYVK